MENKNNDIIYMGAETVYLAGSEAMVKIDFKTQEYFAKPDQQPYAVEWANKDVSPANNIKVVPWGDANDMPKQIKDKVDANEVLSTDILFNVLVAYGDGIRPVFKTTQEDGTEKISKCEDKNVLTFFAENNIPAFFLSQLNNLFLYNAAIPEFILNMERKETRKIVELNNKEVLFSRWAEMNKDGEIPYHLYSAKWDESATKNDIVATHCLNSNKPLRDLKIRSGKSPNQFGKINDQKIYRFVYPIHFPSPGRFYYPKCSWYSLFLSGWYDFAQSIPAFKKAIMTNQMTVKYKVIIHPDYFPSLFKDEGITTLEDKKKRINQEYTNINNFLTGNVNAGKSIIMKSKATVDGKLIPMIEIIPLENHFKGGEYLEDSEEASNIISFTQLVHPSLVGSAPGKSKTINGTEARELFIIKQALMKPYRDLLLQPLYLIKEFNGWDERTHFVVPNIELTTLDQGTGAKKVISQPAN